jgi:hypothetical protein
MLKKSLKRPAILHLGHFSVISVAASAYFKCCSPRFLHNYEKFVGMVEAPPIGLEQQTSGDITRNFPLFQLHELECIEPIKLKIFNSLSTT